MKEFAYNYIYFCCVEGKINLNPNGYYTICSRDLDNVEGIEAVHYPLWHKPLLLRLIYTIHNSRKINNRINIPFKKLWWPIIFDGSFSKKKPLCFVFEERMPIEYIEYLKNKYEGSRAVLIYRDLKKITQSIYPNHPDNPVFDLQMTIDAREAKQYGWGHFDEYESKPEVKLSNNYPESDVFFAGKAKDRLPRLLRAYEIFTKAGLRVKYFLTEVPKSDRKPLPGVEYADKFMTYTEMLYHTVNSRCVLEINQAEAIGYTSRFLEAVMFNKRLITDNQDVKKSKFYSPENILCIKDVNDILASFVTNDNIVDYKYDNEFSPVHLIENIDEELFKRYGIKQ